MQLEKTDLVAFRDYNSGDRNFIFSTWLRGLYYGDSWFSDIPKGIFMENYHRVVEALLDAKSTAVKVACLKDTPDIILGYAVYSNTSPVVHYVFVKSAWRKVGLAKSLCPPAPFSVTHLTKVGKIVKPVNCPFNPFLVA